MNIVFHRMARQLEAECEAGCHTGDLSLSVVSKTTMNMARNNDAKEKALSAYL